MIEKIKRFMYGRYGGDELSKFLVISSLIIMGLSIFVGNIAYMISIILLVFSYYRMMSKNTSKRYKENYMYLQTFNKIRGYLNKAKYNMEQRKIYHIYKCPSCKQKVRIPKGKGNITITCPKCKTEFKKKS